MFVSRGFRKASLFWNAQIHTHMNIDNRIIELITMSKH